jgi:hypothetical protein
MCFCGLELAHPIINGSGTFDAIAANRIFAEDLRTDFPFAAYVSKTITLKPREGNPPPRLWEAAAGLINSIGLPNKGLEGYLTEDLPQLLGMTTSHCPCRWSRTSWAQPRSSSRASWRLATRARRSRRSS